MAKFQWIGTNHNYYEGDMRLEVRVVGYAVVSNREFFTLLTERVIARGGMVIGAGDLFEVYRSIAGSGVSCWNISPLES